LNPSCCISTRRILQQLKSTPESTTFLEKVLSDIQESRAACVTTALQILRPSFRVRWNPGSWRNWQYYSAAAWRTVFFTTSSDCQEDLSSDGNCSITFGEQDDMQIEKFQMSPWQAMGSSETDPSQYSHHFWGIYPRSCFTPIKIWHFNFCINIWRSPVCKRLVFGMSILSQDELKKCAIVRC
jgi:hypothetical protein